MTTILTAYLDESGTHDQSPIMVMAGYLGTAIQRSRFETDWNALLSEAGVTHVHAVDLFKRTGQFAGWRPKAINAFAVELDEVIARHLELGFSAVIRGDDYESIYRTRERPPRTILDSKYGVCFRAILAVVPSYIASQLLELGRAQERAHTINFVLEDGHRNAGDARRLFELYKSDALPEWTELVGSFDLATKTCAVTQAGDFLAYATYRLELAEHGNARTDIENSSHVFPPTATEVTTQGGPMVFRIPITKEILLGLKDQTS